MNDSDTKKLRVLFLWFIAYFFDFLRSSLTLATVLVLFCDELGLNKSRIGIIWSLPSFLAALSIFVVPIVKTIGYKYSTCLFLGIRNILPFGFLFTPYFVAHFGADIGFIWLAGILLLSSLAGAFGMTAIGLWSVEIIPFSSRSRIMSASVVIGSVGYILGISLGGFWLEVYKGLSGFMTLFLIGNLAGLIPLMCYALLPKDRSTPHSENTTAIKEIKGAFEDKDFVLFLISISLLNLIIQGVAAFISLYMKDYVGISGGFVMQLGTWAWMGTLLATYLWGWISDRFGGKTTLSLSFWIYALFPLAWIFLPRHQQIISFYAAAAVSFLFGAMTSPPYIAGIERFFPLTILPKDARKNAYYAIYATIGGISCGLGPILAGYFLDIVKKLEVHFSYLKDYHLDSYTGLFALHIAIPLVATSMLRKIKKNDSFLTVGELVFVMAKSFPFGIFHLCRFLILRRWLSTKAQRLRLYATLKYVDPRLCIYEIKEGLNDPDQDVRQQVLTMLDARSLDDRMRNLLFQQIK